VSALEQDNNQLETERNELASAVERTRAESEQLLVQNATVSQGIVSIIHSVYLFVAVFESVVMSVHEDDI